jgi:hypothetical protein
MPKEKRTSKSYKDLTLEELLQLPPEEMMAALKEAALNSEQVVLPPEDHPIFQEGWMIFTLRKLPPRFYHSKDDTTNGSEDSET